MMRYPSIAELSSSFPMTIRKKLPRKIVVVFVREDASRRLNRAYRKKDTPTNVLSFRYGDEYGEIVLCRPVIRREAREQGSSFHAQVTWMIVHGMIHLSGVHHEGSPDAERRFQKIEEEVLGKI